MGKAVKEPMRWASLRLRVEERPGEIASRRGQRFQCFSKPRHGTRRVQLDARGQGGSVLCPEWLRTECRILIVGGEFAVQLCGPLSEHNGRLDKANRVPGWARRVLA